VDRRAVNNTTYKNKKAQLDYKIQETENKVKKENTKNKR
jgi:hypothetical protein